MRLVPLENIEVIQKWLTPEMLDLIIADDLFDQRKPYFLLLIHDDDDKPVGFFSVYNIDGQNRKCEVGTAIGERSGHKVTKRAFLELMNQLFSRGIHRVYMKPLSRNERAVKAAKYMGFVEEGIERDSVYKNGKYEDLTILGLLKEDFERKWGKCRQQQQ